MFPVDAPGAERMVARRRGMRFWLLVLGLTVFLTLEPALFLVVLALGLSALTLTWILILVRFLILDVVRGTPSAAQCPARDADDSIR
jgi:hypothetical protein